MEDKIIMSSYKKEIVEREIKSFYKTIFFSPIIVGTLSILGLYRFGSNLPIIIGTVSFAIIFGFFLGLYAPLRAIRKYERLIDIVLIEENKITFKTINKKHSINIEDIKSKSNDKISIRGKDYNSIIIHTHSNKYFGLVLDFFDTDLSSVPAIRNISHSTPTANKNNL